MDRLARRHLVAVALVMAPTVCVAQQVGEVAPSDVRIVGDAIPEPLTTASADKARGRSIVLDRSNGNCLICHQVPVQEERFQGNVGPDLSGVGAHLSAGQIRLRLVDQGRLNATTLMPPFYRIDGLLRVGQQYKGHTVLSALEIEDVVAYLVSLKD